MKHNQVIFEVGAKVRVKSDYTNEKDYRKTIGTVIGHTTNPSFDNTDPFLDNLIEFETGDQDQFANWELEPIKARGE